MQDLLSVGPRSGPIFHAVEHRQACGSQEASVLGGGDRIKGYTKSNKKVSDGNCVAKKGNRVIKVVKGVDGKGPV